MTKFIKKHAKVPFELPKKKKKGEAEVGWWAAQMCCGAAVKPRS